MTQCAVVERTNVPVGIYFSLYRQGWVAFFCPILPPSAILQEYPCSQCLMLFTVPFQRHERAKSDTKHSYLYKNAAGQIGLFLNSFSGVCLMFE